MFIFQVTARLLFERFRVESTEFHFITSGQHRPRDIIVRAVVSASKTKRNNLVRADNNNRQLSNRDLSAEWKL